MGICSSAGPSWKMIFDRVLMQVEAKCAAPTALGWDSNAPAALSSGCSKTQHQGAPPYQPRPLAWVSRGQRTPEG
jgi:hypothetical protein